MARTALAILSTENLLHNLRVIKAKAPSSKVIAMVKANAYGHGLRSVAKRLQKHVASLGVASIDEALALRKAGVTIPITLMEGVFEPDELLAAACEGFHVLFHEWKQIEWLEALHSLPNPLAIWLKIDTGMGRLGFSVLEVPAAYERLACSKKVRLPVGLLSHFACADEPEHQLNQKQIKQFACVIQMLPGPKSFCNSAALFAFPESQYEFVRPGLALYGINPFADGTAYELGLKPVMTLQSRLIAVRTMQKGATVGYGARFTCPEAMPVGVVAMGYGDGYPRTAQDGTPVLVNGVRCPLVGRVSMDMLTIDLRPYPQAQVNDHVVLWGEGLPLEEVAPYTKQIPYDILTAVQTRVRFLWTQNNI